MLYFTRDRGDNCTAGCKLPISNHTPGVLQALVSITVKLDRNFNSMADSYDWPLAGVIVKLVRDMHKGPVTIASSVSTGSGIAGFSVAAPPGATYHLAVSSHLTNVVSLIISASAHTHVEQCQLENMCRTAIFLNSPPRCDARQAATRHCLSMCRCRCCKYGPAPCIAVNWVHRWEPDLRLTTNAQPNPCQARNVHAHR